MIKINLKGCEPFVSKSEFDKYLTRAQAAHKVLEDGTGEGNDFIGWRHLPSATTSEELEDYLKVVKLWRDKGVNLVVVIGIGGSYLGAKAAIEALSHSFASQMESDAPRIVFAGNNLSEDYLAELMDLVQIRNTACVVISKSGTTTEPAVAFRLMKSYIEEKYGKAEAKERIIAVTDKD